MTEISGIPLPNYEHSEENARAWFSTRTTGIYAENNEFRVNSIGGMKIAVLPGRVWMALDAFSGLMAYSKASTELTVETAENALNRIDRVISRYDFLTNRPYLYIKKGTPATNPVAPSISRTSNVWEVGLADIRVNQSVLSITQANIVDQRLNESICGLMRDGVTGIPTQALYDQWWDWFSRLKINAEEKAEQFTAWMELFIVENEEELRQWVEKFKSTKSADFDLWFYNFQLENTRSFSSWADAFKADSSYNFHSWFAELQDTLDENQAGALFNKIDTHERRDISTDPNGTHGLRIYDNKLQIKIGELWVSLLNLPIGFTARYFDRQSFTAIIFDARNYTAEIFDTEMRVEA